MRIQLMPEARMLWIVQMKLMAPASEESATRCSDRIQRSWPLPGEKSFSESGGYPYHPDFEAPPEARKLRNIVRPPNRKSQYDSALRRGNAMSRAPIISGPREFASPAQNGTMNRKIIVVPWIVNSSLYELRVTKCSFGVASCA